MKYIKTYEGLKKKINLPDITDALQYFIDEFSLELKYYSIGDGGELPDGESGKYYIRYLMSYEHEPVTANRLTLIAEFKRAISKLMGKYYLGLVVEFTGHIECSQLDSILDYLRNTEGDEVGIHEITFTVSV